MKMALLYTTLPSSTLLVIILVFLLFTSFVSCKTRSCPPTLPSLKIIPLQPQTPTPLNFPPFLHVAPPSSLETPALPAPFSGVTPPPAAPPSSLETPTLPAPFLRVTPPPAAPPSSLETPTLPAPFLGVTPPPAAPPSSLETPALPAPFLLVTPPSLPETPTHTITPILPATPPSLPEATLPPPLLPVTPPSLPETPTPNVQAPPASPFPSTLPGSPAPKQDNKNACPRDVLKLGVCMDMLGKSMGTTLGTPPKTPCCKIMDGLLDFEAAVCLCTAMRANVMGTVYDFPIAINNVFNNCQKDLPSGFQCE